MNAAAKIGDDALAALAGGAVVPDSFTHGTSAQRQRWFNTGLQTGSVKACDTFSARVRLQPFARAFRRWGDNGGLPSPRAPPAQAPKTGPRARQSHRYR
jgi:hypothetical protein